MRGALHVRRNKQPRAVGKFHADFAGHNPRGQLDESVFENRPIFAVAIERMVAELAQGTDNFGDGIHRNERASSAASRRLKTDFFKGFMASGFAGLPFFEKENVPGVHIKLWRHASKHR
jgi:hypothetical protein